MSAMDAVKVLNLDRFLRERVIIIVIATLAHLST
jgi:hypothetical protein